MKSTRHKPNAGNGVASAHELEAIYEAALDERRKEYGAAWTTVESLMFSLREKGEPALTEPDNERRLSELTADQIAEVISRLMKMRPRFPAITGKYTAVVV